MADCDTKHQSGGHHEGHGHHPPHGGHGGHGGPGGRRGGFGGGFGGGRGDRMERGALRFILLDALKDGPKHGYEIIKGLEERTHGLYAPSPGTVYPTLQYLNDEGQVRSEQDADRRVYHLTDAGRAELDAQASRVTAFWSRFESGSASEASRHEAGFLQEELESLSRTIWGGLRDVIGQGDRETLRRARQAVERCRDEIREIIALSTGEGTA